MGALGRFLRAGVGGDWSEVRVLAGNLALRGTTSVSRFVLMLAMARFLSLDDLGLLGLVLVTVNIAATALGLNFFQFNTREILRGERETLTRMIRDQGVLHLGSYLLGIPLLWALPATGVLPWSTAPWLSTIVVLDHLSQELQRLLVTLSRPFTSNVVLFLRSGLWVYAVVGLMAHFPGLRRIEAVWCGWSVGAAAAVACGVWSMRDLPWRQCSAPVDLAWILRGIRSALVLFAGLVCLRAIFAVDRHLLQVFVSLEAVGSYTFFSGIANTMMVLTESGVLQTQYPRLIRSFQAGNLAEYRRATRTMIAGSTILVVTLALGIAVTIHPILAWVGKGALRAATPVLWILLAAMALQVAAQIARNALYVRQLDWSISAACAIALAVATAANLTLIPAFGILGAGVATLLSMASMILASWIFLLRVHRAERLAREAPRAPHRRQASP